MVLLQKCASYDQNIVFEKVKEIFYMHGGIEKFCQKGMNICIKPNLVARKRPEEAATTHPAIVEAVAKLCIENGANVTIAESPGGLYDKALLKSFYKICRMDEVSKNTGAILNFDLSEAEVINENAEYLKKLKLITPVANADAVINISKLKTHGMMAYTGAVKNLFGCIAGLQKAEYHFKMSNYDEFANCIIDICLASKPTLNIIDGIVGMEKDGPTAGIPKKMDVLISGTDAFETDLVAAAVINADVNRIPVIRNSIRRGLCPKTYKDVEIKGESIESVKVKDFIIKYNDYRSLYFVNGAIGKYLTTLVKPKPVFNKRLCKSCGECARCCPAKVITVEKGKCASVDLNKCIRCYCCQELCPFKAVSIKKPLVNKLFIRR